MGRNHWLPLVIAGSLLIGACAGNPTSPGSTGNSLPAATGAGTSPRPEAGSEKVTIKGAVSDAHSGEGLGKATLVVQLLTTDAMPTITASGSMGASGSMAPPMPMPPVASGDAMAPATPRPTSTPMANAGRMGGTAPARPAPVPEDPKRPRRVPVDDKGQFEVKDATTGTYQITAWAPGYEAMTIVGNRPSQLFFKLVPLKAGDGFDVAGNVLTAAGKAAEGARVVAGAPPGMGIGDSVTTTKEGTFTLSDLPARKTPIAAYVGEQGEIRAWALQADVPIATGKEKKTPTPELTLRAVNQPLVLSGKVTSAVKDVKPRQVSVSLETDHGEIALLTRTPDKEGYFRFALPELTAGQTYHLTASGADADGNVVYLHKHKLNAMDIKLELELPKILRAAHLDSSDEPYTVTWDPQDDVSLYRLRVETTGDEPQTLWEGYSTNTSLQLPDPTVLPLLKKGERYRLTFSAIRVADGENYSLTNVASVPWGAVSSRAPIEFTYGSEQQPPLRPATADVPVPPVPMGTLKPLPTPKPVAKPTAKPANIKQPAKGAKTAKPTPKPTQKPGKHAEVGTHA